MTLIYVVLWLMSVFIENNYVYGCFCPPSPKCNGFIFILGQIRNDNHNFATNVLNFKANFDTNTVEFIPMNGMNMYCYKVVHLKSQNHVHDFDQIKTGYIPHSCLQCVMLPHK